jgi:ribosome maturation factor RimP
MEAEALREIVEGAVSEAGLLLVDLQMVRTGRRSLIRILADREGRITIGECASLSRRWETCWMPMAPSRGLHPGVSSRA